MKPVPQTHRLFYLSSVSRPIEKPTIAGSKQQRRKYIIKSKDQRRVNKMDNTKYIAAILIVVGVVGLFANLNTTFFSLSLSRLLALGIAGLSLYQLFVSITKTERRDYNRFEIIVYAVISLVCLTYAFRKSFLISYWSTIWPIGLIILGIAAYLYLKENPDIMDYVLLRKPLFNGGNTIVINNKEVKNPIARALIGLFVLGVVFLTIFGVVTPILAIVVIIVGGVLLFTLGVTFLSVIIPIAIILSPIIFIIWLLSLLF